MGKAEESIELEAVLKVFISSLITGMETLRADAKEAVTTLRHEPIVAEDFAPRANSPQIACLSELRKSDLVLLTLVMDAGKVTGDFIKDVVLTPMLNSLPPQNINDGFGRMIPNPALQDPTDLRPQ